MKIALIDPSLFTWPYDVDLAKGLEDNGHQVAIFGRNPCVRLEPEHIRYLRQHFYPGIDTPLMRRLPGKLFLFLKGLSHIESMFRLERRLKAWKPDAIHFMWTPLAAIDRFFIPRLRRLAPVVLTVHDPEPFNNNPKAKLQRLGAISIMKRFDQLIVHTVSARKRLVSRRLKANKIEIIPHGLLMEPIETPPRPMPPDGRVTLLLFGQIKPYKGVDVLLQALALLPSQVREKCHVRIVGRPQMPMEPLHALVDKFGLKNTVEFDPRFIPDGEIRELMAQADILLFPYREIDASGVLMLTIPAGKAIVASNIGLFGELLQDGRHGALVPPGDPAALAMALEPLITDEVRRRLASEAVLSLAKLIPTWKEIGWLTERVYKKLLAK